MPRDDARETRPWSTREDEDLLALQREYGNRWSDIARVMGTRTGQQCAQRWRHKVNPNIRRDRWSAAEDEKLRALQQRHGTKWALIAREMGGRTDQQCMGRWRRHLDPNVTRGAWGVEEDAALCDLYRRLGPKWSLICRSVPGRTAQQCRARWFQIDGGASASERTGGDSRSERADGKLFCDHEGLAVTAPMATLSPTPATPAFRQILAEASARASGSPLGCAVARDQRAQVRTPVRASTAMDPMSLWRDASTSTPTPTGPKRKRDDADDGPGTNKVESSPYVKTPHATAPRASTSDGGRRRSSDKLSVLLGVALGRNAGK